MARKIGARNYLECSAWTHEGVREVFLHATRVALEKQPSRPIDSGRGRFLQDTIWGIITTGRKPGKILPRIASFFQFLQNSEPEIQRRVNEMNEVIPPHPPSPGLT